VFKIATIPIIGVLLFSVDFIKLFQNLTGLAEDAVFFIIVAELNCADLVLIGRKGGLHLV
jgi:hypothetical protein